MTNSKSRDVTLRFLSKKIPPKNGLKNRSMMASENPSACTVKQTLIFFCVYLSFGAFLLDCTTINHKSFSLTRETLTYSF